jgi:hypothetical protein
MNPHYGEVASEAISAAGLPPTTERNATRLLALVSADSGHAVITWAALAALWDCSQAVARRHLGHIKSAGIIHYSSNQDVYVNFYAWEPSKISTEIVEKFDGKRAWERDEQAPDPHTPDADVPGSSKNSTNIARGRAIFVEFFDEYRAPGGDYRGGRLVGSNLTTLPGKNLLPTNPPVARPRWETESSEGLLLALGCENLPAIRETARTVPFEAIRAHALAWQRDTKAQSPGGLLHRIRSGDFAVPEITSADRESSLFLRWRTPAELAAEEERERLAIRGKPAMGGATPKRCPRPGPGCPARRH